MSKYKKCIDIEYEGTEVELSLPMASLAKIEALTGTGMLKLLSQAQTNNLTLTNAALIFKTALNNGLEKKDRVGTSQIYKWIDENGVVELFTTVVSVIQVTFDVGEEEDEDPEPGK